MDFKKIINPVNGEYFLILDNGKPYWEVFPASYLEAQKQRVKTAMGAAAPQATAKTGEAFQKGMPELGSLQRVTELENRVKQTDAQVDAYKRKVRELYAENVTLKKQSMIASKTVSTVLATVLYIAAAIGLFSLAFSLAH